MPIDVSALRTIRRLTVYVYPPDRPFDNFEDLKSALRRSFLNYKKLADLRILRLQNCEKAGWALLQWSGFATVKLWKVWSGFCNRQSKYRPIGKNRNSSATDISASFSPPIFHVYILFFSPVHFMCVLKRLDRKEAPFKNVGKYSPLGRWSKHTSIPATMMN